MPHVLVALAAIQRDARSMYLPEYLLSSVAARIRAAKVDAPTCLPSCISKDQSLLWRWTSNLGMHMAKTPMGRSCASLVAFDFGSIDDITSHQSAGQPCCSFHRSSISPNVPDQLIGSASNSAGPHPSAPLALRPPCRCKTFFKAVSATMAAPLRFHRHRRLPAQPQAPAASSSRASIVFFSVRFWLQPCAPFGSACTLRQTTYLTVRI